VTGDGAAHYLVLFVADPAADHHADALRDVARAVEGAGFFDGDPADPQRTVGTFVRVPALTDPQVAALVEAVAQVSRALAARFEVQFREEILGHLDAGAPDARLRAALPGAGSGADGAAS
jgi:hypothetical protein